MAQTFELHQSKSSSDRAFSIGLLVYGKIPLIFLSGMVCSLSIWHHISFIIVNKSQVVIAYLSTVALIFAVICAIFCLRYANEGKYLHMAMTFASVAAFLCIAFNLVNIVT